MMDRKILKSFEKIAAANGADITFVQTKGGHLKATLTKGGRKRIVIISTTPRCHHALKNAAADIRRAVAHISLDESCAKPA